MSIEDVFYNVASEVRKIVIINDDPDLHTIKSLLKRFEKLLSEFEAVSEFVDFHYIEIKRISLCFTQHPFTTDVYFTSFADRVFKKILGITRKSPTMITKMFEQFIKGITYFQEQTPPEPAMPIYHRLYSCGPGHDSFRKFYQQCEQNMQPKHRADVKRRIETCYIERLIYDSLYTELSLHFPKHGSDEAGQDDGHMHRLEIVKADFKTCFPNLDISVAVEYDMHVPYMAKITRTLRGSVSSTEVYEKTIIIDPVMGGKTFADEVQAERKTNQYTYVRVQSFTNQPMWLRTSSMPV